MPTQSALSGTRRADVTGFGVPKHHGDSSALPMLVQSGKNLVIGWMSVKAGFFCFVGPDYTQELDAADSSPDDDENPF
jgi:hypothetical protein